MKHKILVLLVALCAIITCAGCGGGGGGAAAPVVPKSATVKIALNMAVNDLGVLVFDLTPGPGASFSSVKGINEAAASNYVGFINPAEPSNTFTVLNASGLDVPANREILEFTYSIAGVATPPTFQVTGNVTASTATVPVTNIPLAPANFVVTTQYN